jgi:hypothetical protein
MKFTDVLRGYTQLTQERIQQIWKSAHFCLDTNVLLDVYRYSPENRAAFLALLRALKGRLFVPHRVAQEFARNRASVIRTHHAPHRLIRTKLDEAAEEINKKYGKHGDKAKLLEAIDGAKKLVDAKFGKEEEEYKRLLLSDDTALAQLLGAIGEEVGDPYPEADAEKEYKRRKDALIPPYCKVDDKDKEEEDRRRGDVVIWLELLKQYEGTGASLIFVTDDRKENWWLDIGAGRIPQPTLALEMYERTKGELLFYSSGRFLELAPKEFGVSVPASLTEESKQIREQQRRAVPGGVPVASKNFILRVLGNPRSHHTADQIQQFWHTFKDDREPDRSYFILLPENPPHFDARRSEPGEEKPAPPEDENKDTQEGQE